MRFLRSPVALLLLCSLLSVSCASSTPPAIRQVAKAGCDLGNEIRPSIVLARDTIIEKWDATLPNGEPVFTEAQKSAFKKVGNKLPDLDAARGIACAVADGHTSASRVDWSGAVSLILQLAGQFAQFYVTR